MVKSTRQKSLLAHTFCAIECATALWQPLSLTSSKKSSNSSNVAPSYSVSPDGMVVL